MKDLSKKQYEELHKEWADAKEEAEELQKELREVDQIRDNCPKCKGMGQAEDGTGDPAHNPYGHMLYRDCSDCDGKGYIK